MVRPRSLLLLSLALVGTVSLTRHASAALVLDYKASNYNATTGVWANDSSLTADSATYIAGAGGAKPTLALNATPNGSTAVNLTGSDLDIAIAPNLAGANGFTILFYGYNSDATKQYIFGNGSLGYAPRQANGKQEIDLYGGVNYGQSSTAAPAAPTFFGAGASGIDGTDNSGIYMLDGLADGTFNPSAAHPFTSAGQFVLGGPQNFTYFIGEVAEIQVYDSQLSLAQMQTVENQFVASYVTTTPTPEPASAALLGISALGLLFRRRRKLS